MTKVIGDSCTLQKLSKAKLRSKPYQLKLSEIYPVVSELPTEHLPVDSDSDSEAETAEISLPPPDTIANNSHAIDGSSVGTELEMTADVVDVGEEVLEDPRFTSEDLDSTIPYDLDVAAVPVDVPVPDARRSTRSSKQPSWMRSGDYELSRKN